MKASNWIIFGLLFIVVILGTILIFQERPQIIIDDSRIPELRQQILDAEAEAYYWQNQATKYMHEADSAIHVSDSLANLPPKVKHHYHEIYKTIPGAAVSKLDSIIRANW